MRAFTSRPRQRLWGKDLGQRAVARRSLQVASMARWLGVDGRRRRRAKLAGLAEPALADDGLFLSKSVGERKRERVDGL